MSNVKEFLKEYNELTKKHRVEITAPAPLEIRKLTVNGTSGEFVSRIWWSHHSDEWVEIEGGPEDEE